MSIRLKSYFSGTVEAAMALARKEMGDEAMLVHSRLAQPEARHLGVYEVVFGVYPEMEAAPDLTEARERPVVGPSAEARGEQDSLAQQVSELRREMERMMQCMALQNSAKPPQILDARPETFAEPVSSMPLLEAPEAAQEISTREVSTKTSEEARYAFLLDQELEPELALKASRGEDLEEAFEVNSLLGREGAGRVIVVLIGPPGSGKTTTLAKLAARYGLAARKKVHILSIDMLRVGAANQLRTLASLLGIGFGLAETPAELDQMIEEQFQKDLILIDTPGLGKADMEDEADLARMIGSDPDIDTHLVLPASMRAADLAIQVDQFCAFHPRKVIFTRLDEASHYGALVSLAARKGLAVSFLTHGQRIPEDLEPATRERLWELVGVPPRALDLSVPALGKGASA